MIAEKIKAIWVIGKAAAKAVYAVAAAPTIPTAPISSPVQKENSMLGIDNLKRALAYLASTIRTASLVDADKDGNVTSTEYLALALAILPSLPGMFPTVKASVDEAKDLDAKEISELVAYAITLDYLPDDKESAEHLVRALLFTANVNYQFASFLIRRAKGDSDARFDPLEGIL